jgi:hypothetical protein
LFGYLFRALHEGRTFERIEPDARILTRFAVIAAYAVIVCCALVGRGARNKQKAKGDREGRTKSHGQHITAILNVS